MSRLTRDISPGTYVLNPDTPLSAVVPPSAVRSSMMRGLCSEKSTAHERLSAGERRSPRGPVAATRDSNPPTWRPKRYLTRDIAHLWVIRENRSRRRDDDTDLPQFACAASPESALRTLAPAWPVRPDARRNFTVGRKRVDRPYKLHKCLAAASVPSETELASVPGQWGYIPIFVQR